MKNFPLINYKYKLNRILNNSNRWEVKIVLHLLDMNNNQCVATTYSTKEDYVKLIRVSNLLKDKGEIYPKMIDMYPDDNTIICEYIGEFFCDYLLNRSDDMEVIICSVFNYLQELNKLNQTFTPFNIPFLINGKNYQNNLISNNINFLSKVKEILFRLEAEQIEFKYGYGISDPHIWNFRILENNEKIKAFTTDFDFFSEKINCFWELGYFYATFRWLKKSSFPLVCEVENILLDLMKKQGIKAEFMFWLGVLSSYCGYRDSILGFIGNLEFSELKKIYKIIQELEEKVYYLADRVLKKFAKPNVCFVNTDFFALNG